jgi:predicted protein tyrosine phosphatase
MPEFTVCGKSEVKKTVKRFAATHLVTMLDVGDRVFRPPRIQPGNHLQLNFEDEEDPAKWAAPTREHAEAILAFGQNLPADARVVVHCFAGACRSTASALALWLQANGTDRLEEGSAWLKADRPRACPNLLLARFFDDIFGMDGRLVEECDRIGTDSINRWWKLNNPD